MYVPAKMAALSHSLGAARRALRAELAEGDIARWMDMELSEKPDVDIIHYYR